MRLPLSSFYPALIALAAQGACVDLDDKGVAIGDEVGLETIETDSRDSDAAETDDSEADSADSFLPMDTSGRVNDLKQAFRGLIFWGTQNPDALTSAPIDLSTGAPDSGRVNATNFAHQSFNLAMEASLYRPPRTLEDILNLRSSTIVLKRGDAYWVTQKPERLSLQEVMDTPIENTNDIAELSETSIYLQLGSFDGTDYLRFCPNLYEANAMAYVDQFCFADDRGVVVNIDGTDTVLDQVSISQWASPLFRLIEAADSNYDTTPARAHMDALHAEASIHAQAFGEWYTMGLQGKEGISAWTTAFGPAVYLPAQ